MGYPLLRRPDGQTVALHRRRRHFADTGVINGRIEYAHSFRQLLAKFAGGVLTLSSGLSMGREGPSVQMGSYIGDLVSKWGHILSGERKQLLAAGAGAGLAAALPAPLAAATLVIESIERFDAPKTAITTILAGVVAGAIASTIFPINPYHDIQAIVPDLSMGLHIKLYILFAVIVSVFGKLYSLLMLYAKRMYPAIRQPEYIKLLGLLGMAYIISLTVTDLTGGGEQFLMQQAEGGNSNIYWICRDDVPAHGIYRFFLLLRIAGRELYPDSGDRRTDR